MVAKGGLRTCDTRLCDGTHRSLCRLCAVEWPGSAEAYLWQGHLLLHSAFSPFARCLQHWLRAWSAVERVWFRLVPRVGRQEGVLPLHQ